MLDLQNVKANLKVGEKNRVFVIDHSVIGQFPYELLDEHKGSFYITKQVSESLQETTANLKKKVEKSTELGKTLEQTIETLSKSKAAQKLLLDAWKKYTYSDLRTEQYHLLRGLVYYTNLGYEYKLDLPEKEWNRLQELYFKKLGGFFNTRAFEIDVIDRFEEENIVVTIHKKEKKKYTRIGLNSIQGFYDAIALPEQSELEAQQKSLEEELVRFAVSKEDENSEKINGYFSKHNKYIIKIPVVKGEISSLIQKTNMDTPGMSTLFASYFWDFLGNKAKVNEHYSVRVITTDKIMESAIFQINEAKGKLNKTSNRVKAHYFSMN